jgi:hypothetical protein
MQIKNTIEAIHARYSCRAFFDVVSPAGKPHELDLSKITIVE